MTERPTALVTGASRGIGKAIALRLAEDGYDVAITARTVNEGDAREHSSTIKKSDTSPLPGSLATTAELIESTAARVITVPADLLDRDSLRAAAATVIDAWGRVDVLVNNGRYIGPGHMDFLLETPIEILDAHLQANVIGPLVLAQAVLPGMIEHGSGTIVHVTSGAAYADPSQPAGSGGWGMGYAISKGGGHRIAGMIDVEYRPQGIRAFNVQPGFIATERMAQDMGAFAFTAIEGAPPALMGAVVSWLVRDPGADQYLGGNVEAQDLCRDLSLLPGWS
jgi:NAD(P)-dependent dehydrogenase (short-subunit alcohol dehydrogenase family)